MDDLTQGPLTDPTDLYRVREELYASDMFIAALHGLDFFTWMAGGPRTVEEIAGHFRCDPRPVNVMTTLFVASELLARDGARLRLTARAAEHLVAGSPWFLGPYFPPIADRPIARDLLDVLRQGRPANFAGREDEADWHRAMETERVAEEFTAAMDVRGRLLAHALAKRVDLGDRRRLLDVAGGSAIYACTLAAHNPTLQASVLEKSPVNRIATRAIEARGMAARVSVVTGDMLGGPLPGGYDVHLLSNVLHDWDEDVARRLVRASADALPAGGMLIVHDTFLNEDKSGPLFVARYSVLLMHVTQGRCYSVAEMGAWLTDAGFEARAFVPTAAGRSALVARKS